jgi:tetratricopeptide (TPR) repeat protein
VVFSRDGRRLAVAGHMGSVQIWTTDAPTLELAASRAREWQETEAAVAEREGRWTAAVLPLTWLIGAESTDASLYHRCGHALAELGQWDRAIKNCSRALELRPNNPFFASARALSLLASGDSAGYRQACEKLVRQFAESTDPAAAEAVAAATTVLSDAVPDFSSVLPLAKKAVSAQKDNSQYQGTLGAVLYRCGDFRGALENLEGTVSAQQKPAIVRTEFFLAMAYRHLESSGPAWERPVATAKVVGLLFPAGGEGPILAASHLYAAYPQAQDWLARATSHMDEALKTDPKVPLPSWQERLSWKLLHAEARDVVAPGSP